MLLNSFPSTYNNVVFTLSQFPSQLLDEMISSLLVEDKRINVGYLENIVLDHELLIKNWTGKKGKHIVKEVIKCYYCRKIGYTTWNCKIQANNLLKGKVRARGKQNLALMKKNWIVEEPSRSECETERHDNETKGDYLFWTRKYLIQEGIK